MLTLLKKIYSICSVKTKITFLFLIFFNLFLSFLETLSIVFIPIFLTFVAGLKNEIIEKFDNLFNLRDYFVLNFSSSEILYYSSFFLIFFFFLKNLLLLTGGWVESFFIRFLKVKFSKELFDFYLKKPYKFFLVHDESFINRNLISTESIANAIILLINIFKDFFLIFFLVFLIFLNNFFIGFFILFIVVLFSILSFLKILKIVKREGKSYFKLNRNKYFIINKFFSSIEEIKILGKEKLFLEEFYKNIFKYENSQLKIKLASTLNRPILEFLSVFFMIFIFLYLIVVQKNDILDILPFLILLSLTTLRLLPSIINLFNNVAQLKFAFSQIDKILDEYSDLKINKAKKMQKISFNKNIRLKNINFSYDLNKRKIINNLDLVINYKDRIGIIGKNGSGKSTLINIISGLLNFSSGTMIFDNKISVDKNRLFNLKNTFLAKQNTYVLNDDLLRNITFADEKPDFKKAIALVKELGLSFLMNFQRPSHNTNLDEIENGIKMSGGQKQMLNLARILYYKPNFLILDEPTSNLDYKAEKLFFEKILQLNATILMVAHRIETLDICNRIILLEKGKIIDHGNLKYFKKKYNNLRNYLG
jgi:ABC-type bacteriocin/lantibiotic exporter with double-glycine peptidase domain